jgi:hypothetical protein
VLLYRLVSCLWLYRVPGLVVISSGALFKRRYKLYRRAGGFGIILEIPV